MKTTRKLALLLLAAAVTGSSAMAQNIMISPPGRALVFTSTAAAAGLGSVSYQWYRDGVAIPGATGLTYTLPGDMANGSYVEFKRGATSSNCPGDILYSNFYIITFCGLVLNDLCWADANVTVFGKFASQPDMYTHFYQWDKPVAWAATGSIVGWSTTATQTVDWTNNPCPAGWRLPTQAEFQVLHDAGTTWVNSGTRGAAVAGCFYGTNHNNADSCSLPNNLNGCIFLPAVGYRSGNNGSLTDQGSSGGYWSGTQSNTSSNGYYLSFNSGSSTVNGSNKAYGYSVRCIR